jgi:hypothetical protein
MCPHCRQIAPIVYRGVAAFCSACGRPRTPLAAPSVSYAGKPSKVGGTVAGVAGWLVLGFGLSISLAVALLINIFSLSAALAVGIPMGLLTLFISLSLLFSGRKLRQSGEHAQKEMRRRAVFALAMNRRGAVTANDAAAALDIPPAEADAFLTDLAKTQPEEVTVELDDRGGIYYAFPRLAPAGPKARFAADEPRVRVAGAPEPLESEGLDHEERAPGQGRRMQR